MTDGVFRQFLVEEANEFVVAKIREAVTGGSGQRYLTFNRFNVRIDLDENQVTIENELDPEEEVTVGLSQFLKQLPGPGT